MGLMEDLTELHVIVPAMVGLGCVVLTVLFIFWLGLGKQRTFEEAKAMASRKAELVLQEEYKNSPRAKKGRKQFPRKKKWEEPQQEESTDETHTRKGILKLGKEFTQDRTPRNRVEFNIDNPIQENDTSRSNPPTPYPQKTVPVFGVEDSVRTAQPIFEEPEEDVEPVVKPLAQPSIVAGTKVNSKKSSADSAKSGAVLKKKPKAKKEGLIIGGPTVDDGLPASRIVEIVGASSLSDDDIQQVMSVLLEKMNSNSEWEAANFRSESVKSLKKQNQELQKRCEEAETTVHSHNTKIKELRVEIQNEKFKHQAADAKLQAKMNAHSQEVHTLRTRLGGLEEDNKILKANSNAVKVQQLDDEIIQLRQKNAMLVGNISSYSSQIQDLSKENQGLKAELQSVKEANRAGGREQVASAELQALVQDMEEKTKQLQVTVDSMNEENSQLKKEVATMKTTVAELERFKASVDDLQTANNSLLQEKTALLAEIEQLRSDKDQLTTDNEQLIVDKETLANEGAAMCAEKERLEALHMERETVQNTTSDALKEQYENKMAAAVANVRQELQSQVKELEDHCGEKEKEVDHLRAQLEKCSSLEDELKALRAQLSEEQFAKQELEGRCGERQREVQDLRTQLEKCSSLKSELEALSTQLNGEQTAKQELVTELESLKKSNTNGPPVKEPDSAVNEVELAQLREEKAELQKKLNDIKDKTNSLRESLWKAKDESAEANKVWESKLVEAHKKSEKMCKQAKKDTLAEAWEVQRSFLVQLFPTVTVEESDSVQWLDQFESKVTTMLADKDEQLAALQSQVVILQENDEVKTQEVENHRKALQATMSILEGLQSEVESDTADHNLALQEKEAMLRRERDLNKELKNELKKEQKAQSSLRESTRQSQSLMEEVEAQLKEVQHQHELSRQEAESLRHSLKNELEMKDRVQEELEALQETQGTLKNRLATTEEEKTKTLDQVTQLQSEIGELKIQLKEASEKPTPVQNADPSPQVHIEVEN